MPSQPVEMSPFTHASLPQGGTLLTLNLDLDHMVHHADQGGLAELRGVAKILGLDHKVARLRTRTYAGYQVVRQATAEGDVEVWRGTVRGHSFATPTAAAMKAEAICTIIEQAIHGGDA